MTTRKAAVRDARPWLCGWKCPGKQFRDLLTLGSVELDRGGSDDRSTPGGVGDGFLDVTAPHATMCEGSAEAELSGDEGEHRGDVVGDARTVRERLAYRGALVADAI